jgi:hypothetical protein
MDHKVCLGCQIRVACEKVYVSTEGPPPCARNIKESRPTVRPKRAAQQRKGKICPACAKLSAWKGYKKVVGFIGCGDCNGTGRLRPC